MIHANSISRHLVVMGSCNWDVILQCCIRDINLFYIFDWTNKTWSSQDITPVTFDEVSSSAVEINSYFLTDDVSQCINIKWPKCIQNDTDYWHHSELKETVLNQVTDVETCANICQQSPDCYFWVLDPMQNQCILKESPTYVPVYKHKFKSGERNVCFEQDRNTLRSISACKGF